MGIFEDGYLGAVVRGIGSNQKQQQLLNIFDQISSSCDQPSLRECESSSPVGSEALETVSRESPPDMLDGTVPLDHPRAEEIDLHEILDAAMHQSSPPFLLEPSHSPSSSSVKAQVSQQIMAAAPEASAIPRTALTPGDDDQPDDPNHHLVPLSPFSQSVPPSDSVLSTKAWAALKIQKHEPFSANNSDPTTPALQKQSPALPTYDHPTNSKQQGSKRRKGQQKRVVCVPIAGGGNSSEVLPSDMWAWRKYGQKPIKGSPYPRGYYRCSSSKGCSARKQVERSRADPSMLVVTYTSEHNHAWPAHRNSLAGTTRSKSIDKLRRSSPQPTPAASAAAANSSSSSSDQIPLHLQEHSLILPSAMEVSADAEAFALEDHDNLLVLDSAPLLSSQDQHLFQDLEELPELAAFMDDSFFSYRSAYDDTGSMQGVDPFDLFCWSSSSFQGSEIAGT